MRWGRGGGGCRVCKWSPNKLWRSNSIFNLWLVGCALCSTVHSGVTVLVLSEKRLIGISKCRILDDMLNFQFFPLSDEKGKLLTLSWLMPQQRVYIRRNKGKFPSSCSLLFVLYDLPTKFSSFSHSQLPDDLMSVHCILPTFTLLIVHITEAKIQLHFSYSMA
jgi:hypothetical protein